MSFRCENCKRLVRAGIKPVRVVTETKEVEHVHSYTVTPKSSRGRGKATPITKVTKAPGIQIVREKLICPPCSENQKSP